MVTLSSILRGCRSQTGQATAELALVVPLFLVALLMTSNILLFASGAATFDRAVEQWSRANVSNPGSPFRDAALPLRFVLGADPGPQFQASCAISGDPKGPFDVRTYKFTLYYTPIGADVLSSVGLTSLSRWTHRKTVFAPHYLRAVVL